MIDRPQDGQDLDRPADASAGVSGSPGEAAYERRMTQAKEAEIAQLPEITVQGRSIPWWVWGLVGGLAMMMLLQRKRT